MVEIMSSCYRELREDCSENPFRFLKVKDYFTIFLFSSVFSEFICNGKLDPKVLRRSLTESEVKKVN
jgi:hypothetical protein